MGKPRKPRSRGDVTSWSFLRVRERVATVRVWMYEHPRTMGGIYFVPAALMLEHYQVTFPWVASTVQGWAA